MRSSILLVLLGICYAYAGNTFFTKTNWYRDMKWCAHQGAELLLGDFNGDGKSDLLCHDHAGNLWTYLADKHGRFTYGASVHHTMKWCGHAGSKLFIGDFNGDKKADIFCHDYQGSMWIAVMNAAGQFVNYWHRPKFWCGHHGSELHLGDFNGDGRTDVLCHDLTGNKWVMHAPPNGHFNGRSWHKQMGWCRHKGAKLIIKDFNGDGRDDMMCHDLSANKWVALATCQGNFGSTSWHGMTGWCSGKGAHLFAGYFNGDTRADLLCHQDFTGKKWIALARRDYRTLFQKTDWYSNMNWCGKTGEIHIGDFNGDGKDDLLCHEPHTGKKWIAYDHHQF